MQLVDESLISPRTEWIASATGREVARVSRRELNCWWRQTTMSCALMHEMELRTFHTLYEFWRLNPGRSLILNSFSEQDAINLSCSSLRDNSWTVFLHRHTDASSLLDEVVWSNRTYTYRSCALVLECNHSVFRLVVLDVRKWTTALPGFPECLLCFAVIEEKDERNSSDEAKAW